jgi:glyoxylase-like metal-dependent hydrolase (beta-lactamase superfamily II)
MSSRPSALSRRDFLQTSSLAAATLLAPRNLFAQTPTDAVSQMRASGVAAKIAILPARRNVSVLMGSGGNIAVLTGKDGKLLVDSGFSTSQTQIAAALASLSTEPPTHLIDTHWHFDHTDGNLWMHQAGAAIIAHENTKKRLGTTQTIAAFHATFPPSPAGALPTSVFSQTSTLATNGETVAMVHYEPAHTDTDISVRFENADVLHVGDTWFNGFYPFIDYTSGGSIDGMIHATKLNLAQTAPRTIIIPGHGPVGDKMLLAESYSMLTAIRERVAALKQQGKPIEAVIAEKPTAAFDARWGNGLINGETFTRLVYQGV